MHTHQSSASDASDWSRHVRTVYIEIYGLTSHTNHNHLRVEYEARVFDTWHGKAVKDMSLEKYRTWHTLVQSGVVELLYFLYNCLCELLEEGHRREALQVLVRYAFDHSKSRNLAFENLLMTDCFVLRHTGHLSRSSRGL